MIEKQELEVAHHMAITVSQFHYTKKTGKWQRSSSWKLMVVYCRNVYWKSVIFHICCRYICVQLLLVHDTLFCKVQVCSVSWLKRRNFKFEKKKSCDT